MSRIGKKPITIPAGVEVKIDGNEVTVSGPKGVLTYCVRPEIKVEIIDQNVVLSPQKESKQTKAFWGLSRALIANMMNGVVKEYEKRLQIEGIGYRAAVEGRDLVLQVGFSHPVKMALPEEITVSVNKNIIIVSGIDKGKVTHFAAKVKRVRPPEPYKGKGIRYEGEVIRKKLGKRAVTTGGK
ncbi:MAG: 50S ribosomal protein L6 [bacterium]